MSKKIGRTFTRYTGIDAHRVDGFIAVGRDERGDYRRYASPKSARLAMLVFNVCESVRLAYLWFVFDVRVARDRLRVLVGRWCRG